MKKYIVWFLWFLCADSLFGQVTGKSAYVNGFNQTIPLPNGTNGQVLTMTGTTQIGWQNSGSAPTGSGAFYNVAQTNKQPYFPSDTILPVSIGGSGYITTQTKYATCNFDIAHDNQQNGFAQIRWAFLLDSYSEIMFEYLTPQWQNLCGGRFSGCYGTGHGTGITGSTGLADTGVQTLTGRFSRWLDGVTTEITKGGVYHCGVGGAGFIATKIVVFYITQPLGGTLKMQVNNGTYVTINTFSSTIGYGYYIFRQAPTSSILRILNSSASKDSDEIAIIGMEDTLVNGLTLIHDGTGGLTLDSCTGSHFQNVQGIVSHAAFLQLIQPTVLTFEAKEDTVYASGHTYKQDLDTFLYRTSVRDTGMKHCDNFFIGTPPVSTGDKDQNVQNQMLQFECRKYGMYFYDTWALWGSYAKLLQYGMQGDGTHISQVANKLRGLKFLFDVGFMKNTDVSQVADSSVNTSIIHLQEQGNPYPVRTDSISANLSYTKTYSNYILTPGTSGSGAYVGILNNTPSHTLDVTGNAAFSGLLSANGSISTTSIAATASGSSFVGNATFGNTSSGGYALFSKTGGSTMYILYNSTLPQISFSQPFQFVNQVTSKVIGGMDTNGCRTQSIDTDKSISNGRVVVAHGGGTLELMGAATAVQITEPAGTLQKGDVWNVVTNQSSVSLTWTNSSHFYATPPSTVTYTQGHEFQWDGTKWITRY